MLLEPRVSVRFGFGVIAPVHKRTSLAASSTMSLLPSPVTSRTTR